MVANRLNVLFIEDNEDHSFLVLHELQRNGYDPDLLRVDTLSDVKNSLDTGSWDVILCDYSLPGFNGLDVLNEYSKRNLDIPFIIVSGEIGEDTAVSLMKNGAHDYVFKGNLKPLAPVIQREIRESNNRIRARETEKRREADALKFKAMIDSSFDAITIFDKETLIECNVTTYEMLGAREGDLIGKTLTTLVPGTQPDGTNSVLMFREKYEATTRGLPQHFECLIGRMDGSVFDAEVTLKLVQLPEGSRIQATFRDITLRKKNESEMKEQLNRIMELQQQEMTMISQNPLPLLLMDLELNILKVNESFLNMSGYKNENLLTMKARDFKVTSKSGHGLKDALVTKKAVTGNIIVDFPTGIHHIEQDIIPLLDHDQNVVSVMATYKDKTEEIRKGEEIERMIVEAKDYSESLNHSATDIGRVFEEVSRGNLSMKIPVSPEDPLEKVKSDANQAFETLRAALREVNDVSAKISGNMKDINGGSSDIARATQQVSQTTLDSANIGRDLITHMENITDQISSLSASNEEITSTSQEILRHAKDVTERGNQAQSLGNEANERMNGVIRIAKESVEDIDELNTHILEITKIVRMINDIAGQINLLALNAAIEAARAGDAGRGFAVVAGEVKNLAADARSATDHIGEVINTIQKSSEKTSSAIRSSHAEITIGVESVNKTIESLNLMAAGAAEVTRDMGDIVKAIEDQAKITEMVVTSASEGITLTSTNQRKVDELSSLTEEVSASVEEINSAIREAEEISSQLKSRMDTFTV